MWNVLLLCFFLVVVHRSQQANNITVFPADPPLPECQNETQCLTLSMCLSTQRSLCFASDTVVTFMGGEHIANGSMNYLIIKNVANLSLIGSESDGPAAKIHCNTTKGFAIVDAQRVTITALAFIGCGEIVPSLLQHQAFNTYTRTYLFTPSSIKAALFLVDITELEIQQCQVNDSDGFGLFALNILGHSTIVGSDFFSSNRRALSLNISHCRPDSLKTEDCTGGNAAFFYQDLPQCPRYSSDHMLNIWHSRFLYGVNMDYEAGGWIYPPNYIASAGGLSIFSGQTSYNVQIHVYNVTMDSNIGYTGANLVLFIHDRYGRFSGTTVCFDKCIISNGNVDFEFFSKAAYAGGVHIYYGSANSEYNNAAPACADQCSSESYLDCSTPQCRKSYKVVLFSECKISNNKALWGAAFYISSVIDALKCVEPEVTILECDIFRNSGVDSILKVAEGYVGVFACALDTDKPTAQLKFRISQSNVFNNSVNGQAQVKTPTSGFARAVLYVQGFSVTWLMGTSIRDNSATGVYLRDTTMNIEETVYIESNTGVLGGGVSLFDHARLNLFQPSLHLFIQNNTAFLGGGIYIEGGSNTCFFTIYCHLIVNETVVFNYNKASAGMSIYGGDIEYCSKESCNRAVVNFFNIFNIPNNSLSEITSDVRRICFCSDGHLQCDQYNRSIDTYPGKTFAVEAVPVGQVDGTVPGVVLTRVKAGYTGRLGPQQDAQQIGIECGQLQYTVSTNHTQVYFELLPKVEGPLQGTILEIAVNFLACPLGFALKDTSGNCDCIPFLSQRGVTCNIDDLSFQRPVPSWIGQREGSIVAHDRCPFDYCKTNSSKITLNNTDPQCAFQRSGILCGECQQGLSQVFQSSRCQKCSNAYIPLLLVFIIAGFLLVFVLIYMDFTVAKGTFNGLMFYANIAQIHHNVIFPPGQSNPLTIFIAWLNLDLGIELCFYDGMDEYGRAWLQFLFPVYIWIIVIIIIVASWYSTLAARVAGSNAVAVLATLFLLSYTKLQRIVLQVLSFTFVNSHDGKQFAVWLYDGNIAYFSPKHAVLSLVALGFLIGFIIPYTLLVLCGPLLQGKFGHLMLRFRITPILDAYQGPYKISCRWWPGIMLLVRSILMLAFASNIMGNPRLNLMLIVTTVVILLGITWNTGTVYKEALCNVLEAFFIANLALLVAWTEFNRETSSNFTASQAGIAYTFVSLSFIVFIVIVSYHAYQRLRHHIHRPQCFQKGEEGEEDPYDYHHLPELRTQ